MGIASAKQCYLPYGRSNATLPKYHSQQCQRYPHLGALAQYVLPQGDTFSHPIIEQLVPASQVDRRRAKYTILLWLGCSFPCNPLLLQSSCLPYVTLAFDLHMQSDIKRAGLKETWRSEGGYGGSYCCCGEGVYNGRIIRISYLGHPEEIFTSALFRRAS